MPLTLDGALIIDKPSGPTSHDVVARVRRLLGERRIGHTGTLDPLATGVLPLLVGRATRLAQFLNASEKEYVAEVTLGQATDSGDSQGVPIGERFGGIWPSAQQVEQTLGEFRGTFLQQPPALSAKKIAGRRSYRIARARRRTPGSSDNADAGAETQAIVEPAPTAPAPAPVAVTTSAVDLLEWTPGRLRLRVVCSAGFYVRSLAHDLGTRLGTGAHLSALRRTRAGTFTLDVAVTLEQTEASPEVARACVRPMADLLPDWPAATLSVTGVKQACEGRQLGADAAEVNSGGPVWPAPGPAGGVRLLDPSGRLVAIAEAGSRPGFLHPRVVLM